MKGGSAMDQKDAYIGVLDSGLGGLSVLRELRKALPQERFVYFGDSANAPYGTRSTEQVRALTLAAANRLYARGLKALVIACNTATSAAVGELRAMFPDRIVVGIEPALKVAAGRFPGGHIGVMATEVTLREEKFAALLARYRDICRVELLRVPGLVELVEAGLADSEACENLLRERIGAFAGQLDAVVLGCTHYPFAAGAIRRVLGADTALVDGGSGTARETKRRLEESGLLRQGVGAVILENSLDDPALLERAWALLGSREDAP